MEEKELEPQSLTIKLPDGSHLIAGEEGEESGVDIETFLSWAMEFVKSPEFSEKILPLFKDHLERKHVEAAEQLDIEKRKMEFRGKYAFHFLWARMAIGVILVAAFIILAISGKIATETTIVALMATLGVIIWGGQDSS